MRAREHARRALAALHLTACPLCARPAKDCGRYRTVTRRARLWWDGWSLRCRWGHEFGDGAQVAALARVANRETVVL